MKKLILFLFLTFAFRTAFAECAVSDMQFFPQQLEISLNSMFIIQGYGMSQKTITGFNNRRVYLKAKDGELIELKLQEILKGQMRLTQAIFKPSKELEPNTTYFLIYTNQTEEESGELRRYNRKERKHEEVYWKTTTKKPVEQLNSNLNFVFEKTEIVLYGCGPSVNALFDVTNKLNSEIWYKTELVELDTKRTTTYYIFERNGKLRVGHGMCAGAFTFLRKGKYRVKFTPMNTDGKVLKATDWKIFENPYLNDQNGFR